MRAGVLTVSDRVSRGQAEDRSGPRAAELMAELGFEVTTRVVPDGVLPVRDALAVWVDEGYELVVTTGGTGVAPRDHTPEATAAIIEREAPGLAEAIRAATFGVNPHGMLSRGLAGIAGTTLIINLPGSTKGVEESIGVVAPALRHAVDLIADRPTDHHG